MEPAWAGLAVLEEAHPADKVLRDQALQPTPVEVEVEADIHPISTAEPVAAVWP